MSGGYAEWGYPNIDFNNVEYVQVRLKITSTFNGPGIPQPGLLLPGHLNGINVFE